MSGSRIRNISPLKIEWTESHTQCFAQATALLREAARGFCEIALQFGAELRTAFKPVNDQLRLMHDLAEKRESELRRVKSVKARQLITRKTRARIYRKLIGK